MATAPIGQDRLIPLVQKLSIGARVWLSGGIRCRPDEQGDLCKQQTMSDRLVAATNRARNRAQRHHHYMRDNMLAG